MSNRKRIDQELEGVKTIAIAGHIRPDGDCIGACLGMQHYLEENFPQLEKADVYLEEPAECFSILEGIDRIIHTCEEEISYDLFLALDCSDRKRLGQADKYFGMAKKTICYDHHISNVGFADVNYVEAQMSSASELIYHVMDPDKISARTAEALYMGIVHDSGIFQYSSTTPETMRAAADLMEKGFDHNRLIDITFMEKSYRQNLLMAKALMDSRLLFEGKCICSGFTEAALKEFDAVYSDLDGIVAQMRNTTGVEAAVFIYETEANTYKVSMRSKSYVNVSQIASLFGGGGHVRAAGCTVCGTFHEVCDKITKEIEKQI